VVCPGYVRTRISESSRNRNARYGQAPKLDPMSPAGILAARSAELAQAGLDPGCCRTGSQRYPRRRALCVHASRRKLARRDRGAVCSHLGRTGQGCRAVSFRSFLSALAPNIIDPARCSLDVAVHGTLRHADRQYRCLFIEENRSVRHTVRATRMPPSCHSSKAVETKRNFQITEGTHEAENVRVAEIRSTDTR
jgi:hypothetical protein